MSPNSRAIRMRSAADDEPAAAAREALDGAHDGDSEQILHLFLRADARVDGLAHRDDEEGDEESDERADDRVPHRAGSRLRDAVRGLDEQDVP